MTNTAAAPAAPAANAPARRALRIGYAAGSTDGGEWLTIWGSAYRSDLVYATREEADVRAAELRTGSAATMHDRIIVARVERLGGLYNRILADEQPAEPAPAAAEPEVTADDLDAAEVTRSLCPVCAGFTPEVVARNGCTHSERPYPYVRL